jgi:hypothetical protein
MKADKIKFALIVMIMVAGAAACVKKKNKSQVKAAPHSPGTVCITYQSGYVACD